MRLNLKEYGTGESTTIQTSWLADDFARMTIGGNATQDLVEFLQSKKEIIEENIKVITPRPMKTDLNQKLVKFEYKRSFLYSIMEEAEMLGII